MGNLKVAGLDIGNNTLSMNNDGKILVNGTVLQTEVDGVLPTGGTTGQILAKIDNTDYNTTWIDAPTGGGSAEYPDMTGNAGKVLGTDGTNVSWVDNGDAVALNMRYAGVSLYISASPGGPGANTNWLTDWYSNNTMDISQKVSNSRLLLKAGRTYRIIGGTESSGGTTGSGITTKLYSAKVSDGIFTEVSGGFSYNIPVTNTSNIVRSHMADCYIKADEDMWVECRIDSNNAGTVTNFASDYMITEYLNVTGEGAITLPPVTNQSGKFLSNNGTDIEWVKPEFNGLSELPQYQLNTEVLTSERWLNGKPIYKKVIDFGTLPNATSKTVAHGITNADVMWLDRGSSMVYLTDTPTTAYGLEFGTNTDIDVHAWSTDVNNTTVRMYTYSNRTTFSAYMTIKYTKATDTASSSVALIGGKGLSELPAYSTNEVLTSERWIDGKPIYRKVLSITFPAPNTVLSIATGITGIESIVRNEVVDHRASNTVVGTTAGIGASAYFNSNWYTYYNPSTSSIVIYTTSSQIANLPAKVILEYTKASDTASSPVALVGSSYNISSTEYVLPYTRNGKTVYGMEVSVGNLPNATTKLIDIPNYNSEYIYWIDTVNTWYKSATKTIPSAIVYNSTTLLYTDIEQSNKIRITSTYNASGYTDGKVVLNYTKN